MRAKRRGKNTLKFEIYSIFGQIEAAAANHFIEHHGATRIPLDRIPEEAQRNDANVVAKFAVLIPAGHVAAFNRMCEELRA